MPVLLRSDLEKKLKEQGLENWERISRFLCDGDSGAPKDYTRPVKQNYPKP